MINKRLINLIKKIFYGITMIYSFDMLLYSADFNIPINYYTIGLTTILGVPGLFILIILKFII